MSDLLKISQEIISIVRDLRDRFGIYYVEGDLYDFDQLWGSTALGLGGMGGSAMVTARTYVYIPSRIDNDTAYVYFGSNFAYRTPMNKQFWEDIKSHRMKSVMESGVYKTRDQKENQEDLQ